MQEEENRLRVSLVNTVRSFSLGFTIYYSIGGEMYKIPSPSFSGVLVFGFLLLSRAPQQSMSGHVCRACSTV